MLEKPFIGLNPYSEEDAPLFFGRTKRTKLIADNLKAYPLTILYGDSGVGKSSLLRAGVVDHLHKSAAKNLKNPMASKFEVVVFPALPPRNGSPVEDRCSWNNPVTGLMKQIEEDITKTNPNIPLPDFGLSFLETLQFWTERLKGDRRNGKLLIVLDQFEEYFNPHPSAPQMKYIRNRV